MNENDINRSNYHTPELQKSTKNDRTSPPVRGKRKYEYKKGWKCKFAVKINKKDPKTNKPT